MPIVSRYPQGTQAKGMGTGPGSESGAESQGGILKSWESHTVPSGNRKGTTPVYQRPGTQVGFLGAWVSEELQTAKEPVREGNRSAGVDRWGSLRGLIVAMESRRTEAGGSL